MEEIETAENVESAEKSGDSSPNSERLRKIRDEFVGQWGVLGTQWGINRTMAQIHALLITTPEPMCTDSVMESLGISRGNAHTNLKELVGWGLIRIITKRGERREFFEAEKDVWEMFRKIFVERQRREIDPAVNVLRSCLEDAEELGKEEQSSKETEAFIEQLRSLEEFINFGVTMGKKVTKLPSNKAMQTAFKIFG